MSGVHALLAPSSAGIWAHCSGSVTLGAQYPQEDTDQSREGEAAHWVVSSVLESYVKSDHLILADDLLGDEAPNGVIVTDEMIEAADVMISHVLELCQEHGLLRSMHVEEWVPIDVIHTENAGTPDCWVWHEELMHLHIWDYKHGHGAVDAEENWQLINYAAGVLQKINSNGYKDVSITVSLHVVQPRCFDGQGPVKTWTIKASELRGYFNKLEAQANEALGPNPVCKSGNHCQYCPAIHACHSARQSAHAVVDYVYSALPDDLSDAALSFELQLLERAKNALTHRLKAIETEAIARMGNGNVISGYAAQEGEGKRVLNAPVDELEMLGSLIGVELLDRKPITPSEFERRLKKINKERDTPIDASVISGYISTPGTGIKLVSSKDSQAYKVFGRKL